MVEAGSKIYSFEVTLTFVSYVGIVSCELPTYITTRVDVIAIQFDYRFGNYLTKNACIRVEVGMVTFIDKLTFNF